MARLYWRFYRTRSGRSPVREFLANLHQGDRKQIRDAMKRVEMMGLREAKRLTTEIWEVKAEADRQSLRLLFGREGHHGQVLLAVVAFSKKTQKTPLRQIRLAETRLEDWRRRGRAMRKTRVQRRPHHR